MTNIVPFEFEGSAIRVVDIDGAPWFVGKDVAERLGYANATDAINKHCRGVAKRYPILDALGRTQEARILSESDVLLRRMKRGEAEAEAQANTPLFAVTGNILPLVPRSGEPRPA